MVLADLTDYMVHFLAFYKPVHTRLTESSCDQAAMFPLLGNLLVSYSVFINFTILYIHCLSII